MSVIYQNNNNFDILKDACLCFGVFDGVHEGHKFEINQCIADAQKNSKKSVCVTFDIDPDELFVPNFLKLLNNKERIEKLQSCNLDYVYVIDFKKIMTLSGNDFLDYFFGSNVPYSIHIGKSFRFGSKQSGDIELLESWAKKHNMRVNVHNLLTKHGKVISSTYLRAQIKNNLNKGDVMLKKNICPMPKIDEDFEKKLNDYAQLLIQKGVNLQQGEILDLIIDVKNYIFAQKIVDCAYQAGAADVKIRWDNEYYSHERIAKSDVDVLEQDIKIDSNASNEYAKNGASLLVVLSDDPSLFNDIDTEKLTTYSKVNSLANKPSSDLRHCGKTSWCIATVPGEKWAKTVFPDLDTQDAIDKLWDCIFEAAFVDGVNTEKNWDEHISNLENRSKILNDYRFKSIHLSNSLGTDLTVKLPLNHLWRAANDDNVRTGNKFVPNIPTQEIFNSPLKNGVDGVVYSSKPLSLNGQLIDGIRMQVKDGKIIDIKADTGEDFLKAYISKFENADYFGEIALVPYNSPISMQNIIYYQTLFDENASCHLAFGCAFPDNIIGGLEMDQDQLIVEGINVQCDAHVDFMIGTKDMSITGISSDGQEIEIFRQGNFTF